MKRTTWLIAGTAVTLAACGDEPAPRAAPATTVAVERGELSSTITVSGTLTHRAREDGSAYAAVNHARGIYTRLPEAGDEVDCGDVLYRVDDDPVLLVCGTVPAFRGLERGDKGKDVRQLNRTLHLREGARFTQKTERALERLQRRKGMKATGALRLGDAVVLPRAARIAKVTGRLGQAARPGAPVAEATSGTLEVQVQLEPTQQGEVERGDRAQVTLPGLQALPGTVDRVGTVVRVDDDGHATVPAAIRLDTPREARGLDAAPVRVSIATEGVKDVLSVPVVALVGRAGGGFAVEVVRAGGKRELVAVELGLFDTANGRVEVTGAVAAGDRVVVPSL